MKIISFGLWSLLLFSSCAQLHHVQIGDIVSHPDYTLQAFDIKVSETGFNIDEAARLILYDWSSGKIKFFTNPPVSLKLK